MRVSLVRYPVVGLFVVATALLSHGATSPLIAQGADKPAQAAVAHEAPPPFQAVPLKIDVTISRIDKSGKTISSTPFTLASKTSPNGGGGNLSVNTNLAVPGFVDGKATLAYRSFGTQISVNGVKPNGNRYDLSLRIDDSAPADASASAISPRASDYPVLRSFTTSQDLLLRDGVPYEYTAVTDRLNGEVIKVSVTLTVVK